MNSRIFATLFAGILSFGFITTALPPAPVVAQTQPTAQRLEFAAGKTAIVLQNSTNSDPQRYVIRATAGQTIRVEVRSIAQAALAIESGDRRILLPASVGSTSWSGQISTTGDHYISVIRPAGSIYTLSISSPIPAGNVPLDTQHVQFDRGTTMRLTGSLAPYSTQAYLIGGRAGQAAEISLAATSRSRQFLGLYGVDGTVLADGMLSGVAHWNGRFPTTQEYVVQVNNPIDRPTRYTLPISLFNSILR